MQCPVGHRLACVLARGVITTLLRSHPTNYSDPNFYESNAKSPSPVAQWGRMVHPRDVKVDWYTPDAEIVARCTSLFVELISDPVEVLDAYAKGSLAIDDKKVQKHLHIIEALFTSVSTHCGFDFDEFVPLEGVDMAYPRTDLPMIYGEEQKEILLQGQPVRTFLAELLHRVSDRIVNGQQDETKSLKTVLVIYKALAMLRGPSAEEVVGLATASSMYTHNHAFVRSMESRYHTL